MFSRNMMCRCHGHLEVKVEPFKEAVILKYPG